MVISPAVLAHDVSAGAGDMSVGIAVFPIGSVPDHVTFLNQVTYSGNLVQTELPVERKPNQITFG